MLSRFVLEKTVGGKKRIAILQGNVHIAPSAWYRSLETEMAELLRSGYSILYETAGEAPEILVATANGRRLEALFGNLLGSPRRIAARKGLSFEADELKYPAEAVNADVSLQATVNFLDANGVRCPRLVFWIISATRAARNLRERPGAWSIPLKKLAAVFLRAIYRKAGPLIAAQKNGAVMSQAEKAAIEKNIFLLYGEEHISGLLGLFQAAGWELKGVLFRNNDWFS